MPNGRGRVFRSPPWLAYALAVVLSVLTLVLRVQLASWIGSDRPLLILFLLPIILSAFVGGGGPGLTATSVIAVGTFYFVMPPAQRFSIGRSIDPAQWVILSASGVLVSLLSEVLRRSRRQLEAALAAQRETEERYRTVVEDQTDLIARYAADGTLTFVNDATCRLSGKTREELLGGQWQVTTFPEDVPLVLEQLRTLTPANPVVTIENRVLTAAGGIAWMHFVNRGFFDAQGRLIEIQAVGRDVTARKQAEEALRLSEERLDLATRGANDGLWDWNVKTGEAYYSARWKSMLGYGEAELEDRPDVWVRLIHPEDLPRALAVLRGLIETNSDKFELEFRMRHKDGHYVDILSRGFQAVDSSGEIMRMVGTHVDISERKRAEEQIELQAAALESAANGIVITDRSGTIHWVNAAFTKLTGYSRAEVVGQNPRVLRSGRHDDAFYKSLWETIAEGRVWHGELVNKHKDGSLYTEDMTITPVRTGGEITHFIAIKQDVSERKQLEDQLHLAQKMEALGTLAGGVAHDFNNILAAILGNVELAAQDVGPDHPAVESLDEIRRAGRRARDLVQRILTFSRQQPQSRQVIALRPVVEGAVKFLRASLPAGVAFTTSFAVDTPAVLADATQIEGVLLNLCTNAWQALAEPNGQIDIRLDGVTLDSDAADQHESLSAGRWARLMVTDTGSGMDRATITRIFEPFFTTKAPGQGTGLGLSVVHGVVEAHGGAIAVDSQLGKGTTFTLYLPAATAPVADASLAIVADALPAATGQRVLFLDDEEALVFLVARALERLGYRVSGHTRWEEALAALRADPGEFDLVVTDLTMPGASGLDLARELRRLRPELPVVLVSGYISDELRAQAAQAGVRQLVYKPNTVDELCAVVQRLTHSAKETDDGRMRDGTDSSSR